MGGEFYVRKLSAGWTGVWIDTFSPDNLNAGAQISSLVTAFGGHRADEEARRLCDKLNAAWKEFYGLQSMGG